MLTAIAHRSQNNIIKYATAAIFSPQCSAYVGPGVIDCVLVSRPFVTLRCLISCQDAMRTRNVDTLPAQDDVARTLIVRTAISEALTEKRYRLKTTVRRPTVPARLTDGCAADRQDSSTGVAAASYRYGGSGIEHTGCAEPASSAFRAHRYRHALREDREGHGRQGHTGLLSSRRVPCAYLSGFISHR